MVPAFGLIFTLKVNGILEEDVTNLKNIQELLPTSCCEQGGGETKQNKKTNQEFRSPQEASPGKLLMLWIETTKSYILGGHRIGKQKSPMGTEGCLRIISILEIDPRMLELLATNKSKSSLQEDMILHKFYNLSHTPGSPSKISRDWREYEKQQKQTSNCFR